MRLIEYIISFLVCSNLSALKQPMGDTYKYKVTEGAEKTQRTRRKCR